MSMLSATGRVTRRARRSAFVVVMALFAHGVGRFSRRRSDSSAQTRELIAELRESRDAERRRADELEAQLRRAREDFDRAMARVNDLFWTVEVLPDGEMTLTYISADASGVVGADAREGLDAVAFRARLGHPDDAEVSAAFTASIRAGEAAEVEERLVGVDGVTRWTWSRGTPRREGDRLFYDGITTNITERHQLAEQREALLKREREQIVLLEEMHRSRDDFVALAGHELRTPLTVIKGYAEHLLDDPDLNEEHTHQLEVVVRRAGLMSELIDDLFDLAKLDSPVEAVEFEEVRLDEVVRGSVEAHEALAEEAGSVLSLIAEPVVVQGEHKRLRRMVDQVLHNAVTFSPAGGDITVTVTPDADGAMIQVTDEGIGIPAENLPHVFERLYRGSNAVAGRRPGPGLGLSSALAIAQGHGGTVEAGPGEECGTVVRIRLPVQDPPTAT